MRVYTLKVSFVCYLDKEPAPSCQTTNESANPLDLIFLYLRQKSNPEDKVTESAHPARFSPDDKFSKHRVACKKRFGIYLPDSAAKPM